MSSWISYPASLTLLFVTCTTAIAQTAPAKRASFEHQLKLYRQAVVDDKEAPLRDIADPQVADLLAVAERAMEKLYAGKNAQAGDLRSQAREFERKLAALQSNDLGRWLAHDEETLLVFIGFGQDTIILSDQELAARLKRLKAARDALQNYHSKTAGPLDPRNSTAAKAILEDATWVESYATKIHQRLLTLAEYEAAFPAEKDWSNLPTLSDTIRAHIAADIQARMQSLAAAKEQAEAEALSADVEVEYESTRQELDIQRQGRQRLSELSRKLLENEYHLQAAELQATILKGEAVVAKKKLETQEQQALSEQERLEQYLKSDIVQQLLVPFCAPGWNDAASPTAGAARPTKQREPGPMSLARLRAVGALSPDQNGVSTLVDVATSKHNDRPHWTVAKQNWQRSQHMIPNIDGKQVLKYVEAQKLLIDHGQVLVQLGMILP